MSGVDAPDALKLCAWCVTQWLVEPQAVDDRRDSQWLCPACRRDPRADPALLPLVVRPGVRCEHAAYRDQPGSVLTILAVDDDQVTVQRLGQPGFGGYDGRTSYHRAELVAAT